MWRTAAFSVAVGLLVAAFPSGAALQAAETPPYGLQFRQAATYATGLTNVLDQDGGVIAYTARLSGGAHDVPNFHVGETASAFVPCAAITGPDTSCEAGIVTEVPWTVVLTSVAADGTIEWYSEFDPPGIPTRIESRLFVPGGVAADQDGRVYVADSNNHRIAVFERDGSPVFTLGTFGQVYTMLEAPDPTGDCYDAVFDLVDPAECPNDPTQLLGRFFLPTDVAVTPDGQTIFVADDLNHRIQVFRRDETAVPAATTTVVASNGWKFVASEIGQFGTPTINDTGLPRSSGATLGQLYSPISVDYVNGRLAISDFGNGRIVVLDPAASSGAVVASDGKTYDGFEFGHPGNTDTAQIAYELNHARDVKIDPVSGRIIVADSENNQVKVFTNTGSEIKTTPSAFGVIGSSASFEAGHFKYPDGIDVYPNGDLLIADGDNGRLQVLTSCNEPACAKAYVPGTAQFASVSSPIGAVILPPAIQDDPAAPRRVVVSEFLGNDIVGLGPLGLRVGAVSAPAPTSIRPGAQTAITFAVTNSGTTSLEQVTPILTLVNGTPQACLPGSYPGSLTPVDIGIGASATFTVCATASLPNTTVTAQVSASGEWSGFHYESDRLDVAPITVEGLDHADMLVAGDGPASVRLNDVFTATMTVTNTGNVALHDVALDLAGLVYDHAKAALQPGAVITAAQIPAGQSFHFTLPFRATGADTSASDAFTLTGTVTATDPSTNASLTGSATVKVHIKADTEPPVFQSFQVRGVNGALPNALGWIKDASNAGATVTVTVADQGPAGLASVEYAILNQQRGSAAVQPGASSATFTTIPIHANTQGRVLVAFWADDTAGNGRLHGLYPGSSTGQLNTGPNALTAFCTAVPQQCVTVSVDTEVPQLVQEQIVISPDRLSASVYFHAQDGQSDVESVSKVAGVQQNASATLTMEPNSNSRGVLVLTAKGTDIWGKISIVDHAGFTNEFTLPFRGPTVPVLRLDNTAPEAFNRLDPQAINGRTCSTVIDGLPTPYLCVNKVYGTDDLPGLTGDAFAPVKVQAVKWGGDYDWDDRDEHHHHAPDGHWDDDHDGYCDNHPGQRLTDDHRYAHTVHDKDNDGHHDKNCKEPHDTTDHSGHWDHDHDGYCDNHPGVRFTDDHRYGYTDHDRNHDGHHDVDCKLPHDDDDDTEDWDHVTAWSGHDDHGGDHDGGYGEHGADRDESHSAGHDDHRGDHDGSYGYGGHNGDRDESHDVDHDDYEHDWDGASAELHTYSFTDEFTPLTGPKPAQSPNRVTLIEKVRQSGNEARVRVMGYKYNDGPLIVPHWAYKKYEWSRNSDGSLKSLNQKFEIGHGQAREQVLANFDGRTNTTTIRELGPHPERKVTVPGLILLEMTTSSGRLRIRYDLLRPVPLPDLVAPLITAPNIVLAEASSAAGGILTFAASATDALDGAVPVTCSLPSGSVRPLGFGTITCQATDSAGNTATKTLVTVVADSTPPVLSLPAAITITGASWSGTNVTYAASAFDAVSGIRPVSCVPVSGSRFKLGTTTVSCAATDAMGNTETGKFPVTIKR
jgi:hypothetical protein